MKYIGLKAKHFADRINEVGFNPFITLVFGAQKPSGHLKTDIPTSGATNLDTNHDWHQRYCSNTFQWVVPAIDNNQVSG